jgi:hypothetical protein
MICGPIFTLHGVVFEILCLGPEVYPKRALEDALTTPQREVTLK